uniref:Paraneoplastic antigen Ma-like C-terminal domain-containing protein n=1 Tax=Leptobrachium leishanense TaxID=445787 RepID=A0A8C5QUL1_9ANUR
MDPDAPAEWCKGQNSQLGLSVAMDIPADTSWAEDQICRAVAALTPDHRGWRNDVPVCFQGASVKLADDVEVRLVQPSAPCGDPANVPTASPTTSSHRVPDTTSTLVTGFPPVALFTAMGKLVETLAQNSLWFYSGKVPVPAGEEDFETWIVQAVQAVEEWEVADTVKRQRLIESLKAPASDVIRNLKRDKPDCTAAEYLEALQEIFGGVEDCAELIHKFSHTYQKEGEELSTYVWRLDKIIQQVILKGGMEPSQASKAMMDQIFKGALPLDPIMLKFQTRYQSKRLTYSKLKEMFWLWGNRPFQGSVPKREGRKETGRRTPEGRGETVVHLASGKLQRALVREQIRCPTVENCSNFQVRNERPRGPRSVPKTVCQD